MDLIFRLQNAMTTVANTITAMIPKNTYTYCRSDLDNSLCKNELIYLNIKVILQDDGNLVMYDTYNPKVLWASNIYDRGTRPYNLNMLTDGHLVIYDTNRTFIWGSGSYGKGKGPYKLYIIDKEDDVNLVIKDSNDYAIWFAFGADTARDTSNRVRAYLNDINIDYNNTARYCKSDVNGGICNKELLYLNIKVLMQDDGNLAMHDTNNPNLIWATNTYGKGTGPYRWILQSDGNLVIYDVYNSVIWATNSYGKGERPYILYITNKGDLIIIDNNKSLIWNSNTSNVASKRILNFKNKDISKIQNMVDQAAQKVSNLNSELTTIMDAQKGIEKSAINNANASAIRATQAIYSAQISASQAAQAVQLANQIAENAREKARARVGANVNTIEIANFKNLKNRDTNHKNKNNIDDIILLLIIFLMTLLIIR